MWKIFGVETPIVRCGDIWKERLIELSKRKKDREKFVKLLATAEIDYWFDSSREIHAFYVKFPENTDSKDLQFFKDFIDKIRKSAKFPMVEMDGKPQEYRIVLTSSEEEDVYKEKRNSIAEDC
ncbi:MAG: hypothetical protein QXN93_03500 [Methanomassiliicoccales archaeon]